MRRGCGRLHPGGALRGPGAAVRPRGGGEEEENGEGDAKVSPGSARPGPAPLAAPRPGSRAAFTCCSHRALPRRTPRSSPPSLRVARTCLGPRGAPSGRPGLPPTLRGVPQLPPGGSRSPHPSGLRGSLPRPSGRAGVPAPSGGPGAARGHQAAAPRAEGPRRPRPCCSLFSGPSRRDAAGRCFRAGGCSVPAEPGPEWVTGAERAAAPGGARPAGRPHRRGHQWSAGEPHKEWPRSRGEPPGAAPRC